MLPGSEVCPHVFSLQFWLLSVYCDMVHLTLLINECSFPLKPLKSQWCHGWMTRMSRSVPTVETSSTSGTGVTTVVSVGPSCVGSVWNSSPCLWPVRMYRTPSNKEIIRYQVKVLWNVCLVSVLRKADQWNPGGPVRAWKPRSDPVAPSRRWRQRDGLQEGQHQQPEQRYLHAGGKGWWEDSLLSPLYGHTAEEAAEVGREGSCARYCETLRGKNEKNRFLILSPLLFPVVQWILGFLFLLSRVYTAVSFLSYSVFLLGFPVVHFTLNLSSCQRLRMCMEKVDEKAPEYIRMAESLK